MVAFGRALTLNRQQNVWCVVSRLTLTAGTFMLAIAGLVGCSNSSSRSQDATAVADGPIRIGVSFQELDNPYFVVMKEAVEEAAHSIGAELYLTDARHDVTKQISDIEDLIQ